LRSRNRIHIDGSVTLETCLILPVIIGILIFGLRIVQTVTAVNCLDRALYKTARLMSDYAILYHEYGLEQLENDALSALGNYIEDKTGSSTATNVMFRFFFLRECASGADDLLYAQAGKTICKYYLDTDPLIKNGYIKPDDLSFNGSKFFNTGDDIELYASYRLYGWLKVGTSIRCRAWIRGNDPLLSINESGVTVWQLNNFARGKILRTIFGGNLPYDYPVLSAYDEQTREAVVIKSIDLTAPYYKSGKELNKEIREMIDKFSKFNDSSDYQLKPGYPVINSGMISSRKLILIVPENDITYAQSEVLHDCMVYCFTKGIIYDIVQYQRSDKYTDNSS
jgi:hypothetical protein